MISTVTGSAVQDLERLRTTEYWVSNIIQPVRYAEAVNRTILPPKGTRKLGTSKQEIIHNACWSLPLFNSLRDIKSQGFQLGKGSAMDGKGRHEGDD